MWDLEFIWSCSRSISRTSGWMRCWGWSPQILKPLPERREAAWCCGQDSPRWFLHRNFLYIKTSCLSPFIEEFRKFFHLKHTWFIMNHNYTKIIQAFFSGLSGLSPSLVTTPHPSSSQLGSCRRNKGTLKVLRKRFWKTSCGSGEYPLLDSCPPVHTWYERSIQRIGVVSVVGSSSLDTKSHLHRQLWVIRTLRTLLHTSKASSFVVQFTIGLHYISFGVVNYSIFDRKVIADSTQYSYATALKKHKIECITRFFYPWRRHRRRLILQYFLMLFLPKTVGFQLATFVSWGVRSHSEMLLRGVGFLYLILFMSLSL